MNTPARNNSLTLAIVGMAAVLGLSLLTAPWPAGPNTPATGDQEIIAQARPALEREGARDRVSITVIEGDNVRQADFGADSHTEYEIGSTTKTFTGLLLADAVERKELTLDTKVGSVLDLGDAPVADVTLEELSLHRAGIVEGGNPLAALDKVARREDTIKGDVAQLLDDAQELVLQDRGTFQYSNLGVALLGQAVAQKAGLTFPELLQVRILDPLDMSETRLPLTKEELGDNPTVGITSVRGIPSSPIFLDGYAPAGGARSNSHDMTKYAQALLDGKAPGMAALEPAEETDQSDLSAKETQSLGTQFGLNWFLQDYDGRVIAHHPGGTAGFSTAFMVDRKANKAVIVMSSTTANTAPIQAVAEELMLGDNK